MLFVISQSISARYFPINIGKGVASTNGVCSLCSKRMENYGLNSFFQNILKGLRLKATLSLTHSHTNSHWFDSEQKVLKILPVFWCACCCRLRERILIFLSLTKNIRVESCWILASLSTRTGLKIHFRWKNLNQENSKLLPFPPSVYNDYATPISKNDLKACYKEVKKFWTPFLVAVALAWKEWLY